MLIYLMLGGVLGSKIYFTIDVGLRTGVPFADLFLSPIMLRYFRPTIGDTSHAANEKVEA